MEKVRLTHDPREEVEMDEHDADVHRRQGLLYEGTDADLKALLAKDPTNRLSVAPAPTQKGIAAAMADIKMGAQP